MYFETVTGEEAKASTSFERVSPREDIGWALRHLRGGVGALVVQGGGETLGVVSRFLLGLSLLRGDTHETPLGEARYLVRCDSLRDISGDREALARECVEQLCKTLPLHDSCPVLLKRAFPGGMPLPLTPNGDGRAVESFVLPRLPYKRVNERGEGEVVWRAVPHRGSVLVTGGAGYIGSILVKELLVRGYMVTVVDKMLFGDVGLRELFDRYPDPVLRLVVRDVGELPGDPEALLGAEHVVHLAAIVGDAACQYLPGLAIKTNYSDTLALLSLADYFGVERMVFASTCSVYGKKPGKLVTEEEEPQPLGVYAKTKVLVEEALLSMKTRFVAPVILRFGTIYGYSPRMRFDLVVNIMTAHAYHKKKITVYGGDQWRPLVHVRDVARAIIAAIEAPEDRVARRVFNIVGENVRIRELAERISRTVGGVPIEIKPTTTDERNYRVSGERARRELGFEPQESIENGVRELLDLMKRGFFKDFDTSPIYNNYKALRRTYPPPADVSVPSWLR